MGNTYFKSPIQNSERLKKHYLRYCIFSVANFLFSFFDFTIELVNLLRLLLLRFHSTKKAAEYSELP